MSHTNVPTAGDSCSFGSLQYYLSCGVGGSLACGFTHFLMTPLDIVKCRLQVDAAKYKNTLNGFRVTVAESGVRGLDLGWAPTVIGYSVQGFGRFGLYEVCKVKYANLVGPEVAYEHRTLLYLLASASGEFCADFGLAPFEACKVRMQTQPGYASTMREALQKMYKNEGIYTFYKGIGPLWMRQIPYTMMKFTTFERTVEYMYKNVTPKPREVCSKSEQLLVTCISGYIAGIMCAIVSHPADTVISGLNKDVGTTVMEVLKRLGFLGLWGGIGPRILMVGAMASGQWLIYDAVKVWLRIPRPPPPEMPESLKRKYGVNG